MDRKPYPPNLTATQGDFARRLTQLVFKVREYENEVLQTQALSLIPLDLLETKARNRYQEEMETSETVEDLVCSREDHSFRHCLLLELLAWFKRDFFSWANEFPCDRCPSDRNKTVCSGAGEPNAREVADGAGRVELYKCNNCHSVVRFPRYDHPRKLLETRVGRCGEWANCFTLLVRALRFECRLALDWTDHVWTEVYHPSQERWLHCDPCENACDTPLLYETGWNKCLTYVISANHEQIVDVTWRYSRDHTATRSRRLLCKEAWLIHYITTMNSTLSGRLSAERREQLKAQTLRELIELMTPPHLRETKQSEGPLGGRTSGSVQWRLARGEIQAGTCSAPTSSTSSANGNGKSASVLSISPNESELSAGCVSVLYDCAKDEYHRPYAPSNERVLSGWRQLTHHSHNMFRKEELDWKQAYLCRRQGSNEPGTVSWMFDWSDVARKAQYKAITAEIEVAGSVYENGRIVWTVQVGDHNTRTLSTGGKVTLDSALLQSAQSVLVQAELTGGQGNQAWQHAQLFRSALQSSSAPAFTVNIHFKTVI